jgi:ribosomal-protein-alanine N-acetyltransferase
VTYRLYIPKDFEELYAIEVACFKPPARFTRRYMRSIIENPRSATWIAERAGRTAGFAIVHWSDAFGETAAYIETIEVLPDERGQGAGNELMRRLETSAREAGAGWIGLHLDTRNAGAVRLYETHGYSREGREEDYYGVGGAAFVYAKRIDWGLTS